VNRFVAQADGQLERAIGGFQVFIKLLIGLREHEVFHFLFGNDSWPQRIKTGKKPATPRLFLVGNRAGIRDLLGKKRVAAILHVRIDCQRKDAVVGQRVPDGPQLWRQGN
jgi:hypothetical protein